MNCFSFAFGYAFLLSLWAVDQGAGQLGLVGRRESRLQLLGRERVERGDEAVAMDRRLRSRLLPIALLGLWSWAVKRTQRVQD